MISTTVPANSAGVVVIGRNEGERLRRCIESIIRFPASVVYVDSGSVDGSVSMAEEMGVEVVELDTSIPFSAARARNEGYARLKQLRPDLEFVQFVDGDCEIIDGWFSTAIATLGERPELAIVAGWLHERHPDQSVFNRLGDIEWNFAGKGTVDAVGGIFMVRCEAFSGVNGFDPTVAAGEEPELCQRLRSKGWLLSRLDQSMAWHDLAMTRFSQWWRRMIRFGYGSMDVAIRFGLPRFRRNALRARFWTAWLLACLGLVLLMLGFSFGPAERVATLALVALWPLQSLRIAVRAWRQGQPPPIAAAYAFFIMLSFWPQFIGQILYFNDRRHGRSFRLVEYKTPDLTCTARGPAD